MSNDENATPNVDHIVAHPELYGFVWLENQEVQKDGMVLKPVPLVKHNDLDLLRKNFGDGLVLAAMDGTSRHVTNQRIVRDAKWADRAVKTDVLKRLIVENMLGQKTSRKVRVVTVTETRYEAMDGKTYATQLEMQQANLAWFAEQKINS